MVSPTAEIVNVPAGAGTLVVSGGAAWEESTAVVVGAAVVEV
jgi:hypothetical protein